MCWKCKYYLLFFNVTWHCSNLAVLMSGWISFNAVWHTHTHRASWLSYTSFGLMCCQASPLRFLLSLMWRRPHFFLPRSYSHWVLDQEPLFSPWWAAIISSVWPYYAGHFFFFLPRTHVKRPQPCGSFPTPKCSETVMMVTIVMITAMPLFMAGTHRLCGLHCSATFIKSQWVRSIYDCE